MTVAKDKPVPLTLEEKAKVEAETAKAVAETEAAKWDAVIRKADAAVAGKLAAAGLAEQMAIVRTAEAMAEEQELGLRALQRRELEYLALNQFHHVYLFASEVDEKSVHQCMSRLTEWTRTSPGCDIEIILNSPGGDVIEGMALFDYIKYVSSQGHKVTVAVIGIAASMASLLLQAGDVRIMGRESYLMLHEPSFGAMGRLGDVEDVTVWVKKFLTRAVNIYAERSNLSKDQFRVKLKRKDWYVDSEEALKLGLVDAIR